MQAFSDCLANSGLGTIRTVGDSYTWTNTRLQTPIFKRLDRMVANGAWFNSFAEGHITIKPRGLMDHNPLVFEEPMQLQKFGKPFQFFNFMIDNLGFLDLVACAWTLECNGSLMTQFLAKLKHTKLILHDLNKANGNIQSNVQLAHAHLVDFQDKLKCTTDPSLLIQEKDLIAKLNTALALEESLLLQKARIRWMHLGDGNNSFFHQQCRVNWNHNKILMLEDANGELTHGQYTCANVAVQYFQNLLGSSSSNDPIDISLVECKTINDDQARHLVAPVTDGLIFDTLKNMKKNKSPDPDGVNAEFFVATWSLTGLSFYAAVKHFFATGFLPPSINSTFLALIPKRCHPLQ